MRATRSQLALVLLIMGCEKRLQQSRSVGKQHQSGRKLISILNCKPLQSTLVITDKRPILSFNDKAAFYISLTYAAVISF